MGHLEDVKDYLSKMYDRIPKGPLGPQDSNLEGLQHVANKAAGVETSTDTVKGYADGGVIDAPPPTFDPNSGLPPTPAPIAAPGPDMTGYVQQQKSQLGQYGPEQQQALTNSIIQRRNSPGSLIGQGLAGLGDALVQGVAGKGNPGFLNNIQNRQNEQGNLQIAGMKNAREANMQNVEAGSKLDQIDPNSTVSRSKREAYGPVLEALGYQPSRIAKMPASELDNTMSILQQTHGKELEAAWHQVENQTKIKELGLKGQELGLKGKEVAQTGAKNAEEARHNVAEEANKNEEVQTGALEHAATVPLTSRIANMFGMNPAQSALEKQAGLGQTTPSMITPDVQAYAQAHGITPQQALVIKLQRGGK